MVETSVTHLVRPYFGFVCALFDAVSVVFELAQIRHALRIEEDINKSTSYLSLVSTPGNRRRMMLVLAIAIFSQWR